MKLTELKIGPRTTYMAISPDNPLICTVKLESKEAIVQTVLDEGDMLAVLALVRSLVAAAAKRNVDAFCAASLAVEAGHTRIAAQD